ncbi:MAG TPA: hypothetical protein VGM04_05190 [Sphingomicrobium sp.]|jgi:acyl-CoA synthetase (AMP-forming)/AMP-acid ligase II
MGPAYFVIALLGCADGGSACAPVATLETHYATEEQCAAAAGAALIENSDLDYPTLVARCRAAKTESADTEEKPREKRRPS